ncbi:SpoIIE family protein phosphatase [candidate division KSB1 bacterium]|nr:SpoIIE family protein phosphatase [candidate division KSB1 bacterium]
MSSILNSIGEGIVIADRNGALLFFNHVAEEILGIGMQKIDPEKWADVYGCFYPDQQTPFPSDRIPLAQTLKTGQAASEIIYIKNPHKPEGVYIDINSRPILGEAGDLLGGIVVFKDITEQKKTEMTLKKLSSAVEQTADAVIITTANGIIEYVNPAFENMSGYSRDESIGQTPRLLKSGKHDRSFYQDLWSSLLAGKPYKNEMLNRKKNGDYFWVQNTITPMKDQHGKITNFVALHKDITELKAKNEHEIRMQVAREIQQRLYHSSTAVPGFDIAGKSLSADETSGDYFDVFPSSEDIYWLTVGDVSGHGIGPAIIMAETRAYLRSLAKLSSDPGSVLNVLNEELHTDLDDLQYVTLILVQLDIKKRQIVYAGAGHVPGYIIDDKGEIKHKLESTGIPLGFLKNQTYKNSQIIAVDAADMLIFLTDGIIEACDGDDAEFGLQRILQSLKNCQKMSSYDTIEHLYQQVFSFIGNTHPLDDMTALICKTAVAE